ncbi:unnamed protein product [Cutaneotrichosporon oleaginosum]
MGQVHILPVGGFGGGMTGKMCRMARMSRRAERHEWMVEAKRTEEAREGQGPEYDEGKRIFTVAGTREAKRGFDPVDPRCRRRALAPSTDPPTH